MEFVATVAGFVFVEREVLADWCSYCHDRFSHVGLAAVMTAGCFLLWLLAC